MTKTIDQITRTLVQLDGSERFAGRDGSGDFKITGENLGYIGAIYSGKNRQGFINGDFSVWQEGDSFSASGYTADQWCWTRGSTETLTKTPFTIGATSPGNNSENYASIVISAFAGAPSIIEQRIEDVSTYQGKTVTFSISANSSATFSTFYVDFLQNFGSGGSVSVDGSNNAISIDGSLTRKIVTIAIPSISGKTVGAGNYISFRIVYIPTSTGFLNFSDAQVNLGSMALPFEIVPPAKQLSDCQRYGQMVAETSGNIAAGFMFGTTVMRATMHLPVSMRAAPTLVVSAITDLDVVNTGFSDSTTNITIVTVSINNDILMVEANIALARIAGDGCMLRVGGANRFLFLDARL